MSVFIGGCRHEPLRDKLTPAKSPGDTQMPSRQQQRQHCIFDGASRGGRTAVVQALSQSRRQFDFANYALGATQTQA